MPLGSKLPRLLFLLRRQVLPCFNPTKPALLLLGWQAVEVLKPILQSLLLLWRQFAELRIVLQRFLLIRQRKFSMRSQPVPAVALLTQSRWPRYLMRLLTPCLWGARHFMRLSLSVSRPLTLRMRWRL